MKQNITVIALFLSLINLSCSQLGEIKTIYKEGDNRYFSNKTYGINTSSYFIENISFNRITQNHYKDIDSTLFRNNLSDFIVLQIDDGKILRAMDDIDSYRIFIKIDSLFKNVYELNDSNTVVIRHYNLSSYYLFGLDGKIKIDSLTNMQIWGNIEITTSEKRNNSGKSSCEGILTGDFCLPVKVK